MNDKRTMLMNAAVIAFLLLVVLILFLVRPALPERDITPNAGTLEDSGFTFTFEAADPAGSHD